MQESVFAAVAHAVDRGDPAALVTIITTQGSTPQRVGAKMLVHADGRTVGTIGGGCYENDAAGKAREAIRTRQCRVVSYDLADDVAGDSGLICGGQMQVFIEPLDPSPSLYLVGGGHVSQHVARLAHVVGFRVHVLDDREKFASTHRFPDAASVIVDDIEGWLARADLPPTAFIAVVTRGHTHDLGALRALSGRPFRYLGMIGSRAKVARLAEALIESGSPADWVRAIHAPIGLRIGAITPEEIAVSIVAELIAVRRGAALEPETAAVSKRLAPAGN